MTTVVTQKLEQLEQAVKRALGPVESYPRFLTLVREGGDDTRVVMWVSPVISMPHVGKSGDVVPVVFLCYASLGWHENPHFAAVKPVRAVEREDDHHAFDVEQGIIEGRRLKQIRLYDAGVIPAGEDKARIERPRAVRAADAGFTKEKQRLLDDLRRLIEQRGPHREQ